MQVFFNTLDVVNEGTLAVKRKNIPLNINEGYYQELKDVLRISRVQNHSLIRVGVERDGGYIMVDEFATWGGTAYSFGVGGDVSWDADMAKRGYEIFMYDMTIDKLPYENEKFHFVNEGIGSVKDMIKSLDTLENFIKRNGHENNSNMILKMDVEGAEWDFLETVSPEILNQFDQMVFEFHNLTKHKTFSEMDRTIFLLSKLNATHTPVHVHGNNFSAYVQFENIGVIPDVLEMTYLRTEGHNFLDDTEIFLPARIDTPNSINVPDIPLGYWNRFKRR